MLAASWGHLKWWCEGRKGRDRDTVTAGCMYAKRRDYGWVEWQCHLSLAFAAPPPPSASPDSFPLGKFSGQSCISLLALHENKSSTTFNYRCCFGKGT